MPDPIQATRNTTVRMLRQQRLASADNTIRIHAVVDEAALRREVGGPKAMREQLAHLVTRAELSTVELQVLRLRAGAHYSMDGGFTLPSLADQEDLEVPHLEFPTGRMQIEDQDQVAEARRKFARLVNAALDPAGSIELIEQLIAER